MWICHTITAKVYISLLCTHWITIYLCPYVLNSKSDEKFWSDAVFRLYRHKQIAVQCLLVYFCLANGWLQRMIKGGFPKRKLNPNLMEMSLKIHRISDLQKNCQNPTTFEFKLRHIPILVCHRRMRRFSTSGGIESRARRLTWTHLKIVLKTVSVCVCLCSQPSGLTKWMVSSVRWRRPSLRLMKDFHVPVEVHEVHLSLYLTHKAIRWFSEVSSNSN